MWQYEVERKKVRQEKKKRNGVIKKKTLGNKKVVRCVENEKRKHKTKEMEQKERKIKDLHLGWKKGKENRNYSKPP